MGMFDEIVCEYPLPDGWVPPKGTVFQTKDTPDQWIARFTLCEDGKVRRENGEALDLHGTLNFYTSNWAGSEPWGVMTSDDTPPWCADYVALYDHGTLLKIEGQRVPDTADRWVRREEWYSKRREAEAVQPAPDAQQGGNGG